MERLWWILRVRRIIDMIESREFEDVVAWLQSFPNLQILLEMVQSSIERQLM